MTEFEQLHLAHYSTVSHFCFFDTSDINRDFKTIQTPATTAHWVISVYIKTDFAAVCSVRVQIVVRCLNMGQFCSCQPASVDA